MFLRLFFFFFNDTATTEIYTLSLHDALPIFENLREGTGPVIFDLTLSGYRRSPSLLRLAFEPPLLGATLCALDRKSTRLNSSHSQISYAVFCLKKKKKKKNNNSSHYLYTH